MNSPDYQHHLANYDFSYTSSDPRNRADIAAIILRREAELAQFDGSICPHCGKDWDIHSPIACGWTDDRPEPNALEPEKGKHASLRVYGERRCRKCKQMFMSHAPNAVDCPVCRRHT
jgi:hypothetical protein